jgi:spoIIIJ-associated protein
MEKESIDRLKQFTRQLAALGSLRLEVQISVIEGEVLIDLSGQDTGAILSDNARALWAFNHLINQAFFRVADRRYRFVVDCDNHRANRARELQLLAESAAQRAIQDRAPFLFQPMPAYDRRIIHLKLAEEGQVRTESEGRGPYRRIVVFPEF